MGGVTTQSPVPISVQLVDSCHNLRRVDSFSPTPELTVAIVVEGLPSDLNPVASVSNDGERFHIDYVPHYAGNYQVSIQVDGVSIYGSPFSLSWIDGTPCLAYYDSPKNSSKVPPSSLFLKYIFVICQ